MKTITFYFCLMLAAPVLHAQLDYESVTIVSLEDKPIIRTTLNGKEAFFLLDTGSSLSILDATQSKKFGYECSPQRSTRKIHAVFLDGSREALRHASDVNLWVGSKPVRTSFVACQLSELVRSMREKNKISIVGIIGSDIMQIYGFRIDYDKREVWLRNPMSPNRNSAQVVQNDSLPKP